MSLLPSGVVPRVGLAVAGMLLALAAISYTAVRATQTATTEADRVEDEFAERVLTGTALTLSAESLALAEERLGIPPERETGDLEGRIGANEAALASAITEATAPRRVQPPERRLAGDIRRRYAEYVAERSTVLRAGRSIGRDRASDRLRRSFERLQVALRAYGHVHFDEAQNGLEDLRRGAAVRNALLACVLLLGLLGMVAITVLARGIVTRVRAYGAFARQVASGDLTSRLAPSGSDELTGLGHSLNEMVEQLAAAQRARDAVYEEDRAFREAQDAFTALLHVAQSEEEAHGVLKRHLERCVPGSTVVVLHRDAEDDRIRAATPGADAPPLHGRLVGATSRSCLAVRLGAPHCVGGEDAALLGCEICRDLDGCSTCAPLLVGGEALGAVLVRHPAPLDAMQARHVNDSAAQAAPILANLRNLALAVHRAATDPLTGLPNRRAVQDTLRRLMALAARRQTSLGAITMDLDHFKSINDTLGHDRGDTVLAAVGATLAAVVRQSDFVGRVGGEEFIVLLPDSDCAAAAEVAEKLRAAVATLTLDGIDRPLTASFGVAAYPQVAVDAETLLRVADRALYAAKAAGRDRVEVAVPADADRAVGGMAIGDDAVRAEHAPRFRKRG